jgi:hypothetical protein
VSALHHRKGLTSGTEPKFARVGFPDKSLGDDEPGPNKTAGGPSISQGIMMDLPILSAALIGLAVMSVSDATPGGLLQSSSTQSRAEGPEALVGQHLYASEDPISHWGAPLRAEDLSLEDLGLVAEVVTTPEGEASGIVVSVGGIWGVGSEQVQLGMDRIHLVRARDGAQRLVVDLSASGAEPVIDGAEL